MPSLSPEAVAQARARVQSMVDRARHDDEYRRHIVAHPEAALLAGGIPAHLVNAELPESEVSGFMVCAMSCINTGSDRGGGSGAAAGCDSGGMMGYMMSQIGQL